jgi:hypothetical protein
VSGRHAQGDTDDVADGLSQHLRSDRPLSSAHSIPLVRVAFAVVMIASYEVNEDGVKLLIVSILLHNRVAQAASTSSKSKSRI